MEISVLSPNSIKIKSKKSSLVTDPQDLKTKIEADGVVLLNKQNNHSFPKVEGTRLTINGAGEYEVGGIKISARENGGGIVYAGDADGVKFVLGNSDSIEKLLSELDETTVLIIRVMPNFNNSIVSSLSPSIIVLYGDNKEALKILGKEGLAKTSKLSVKSDKLPQESEIVSLG